MAVLVLPVLGYRAGALPPSLPGRGAAGGGGRKDLGGAFLAGGCDEAARLGTWGQESYLLAPGGAQPQWQLRMLPS